MLSSLMSQMEIFHSFLRLSDISKHMCIPFFLIHLSVDVHLGCFRILATVNDAAMTIGMHVSFQNNAFVIFRYITNLGIAGSYGSPILIFWKTCILFSLVVVPVYNPTNSVLGLPFLISFPMFVTCGLFDDSHSGRCKVVSHCDFYLHFSYNCQYWASFLSQLVSYISSLEKYLFRSSAHF